MRTLTIDEANKAILALALEHQLVTRLTSLVAVDKPVTRPAGEPLKVSELPLNLPAGWDFEKIFGERPKPVPPRRRSSGGRRSVMAALGSHCVRVASGFDRHPTATGCRAAGDRHRCRVEDVHGDRADDIRPDRLRISPPTGFPLIWLGQGHIPPVPLRPCPWRAAFPEAARLPSPQPSTTMSRLFVALVLAAAGAILFGQGIKAMLAQVLLERAFAETITSGRAVKPWPWADTWPEARIT